MRFLHKYKARDFAQFLDIFDRESYDWQGEPLLFKKADDIFFERIVGLLPMYVKEMTSPQVIRCFEVMTKRNIGSQRLFDHYILYMIEKHIFNYSVNLFDRMIRTMADKGFVEDFVFWDRFGFKYVFYDQREHDEVRKFTSEEAKKLWDSFVYLKMKCPTLDVSDVLLQLEKFIEKKRIS